jgi:glucose-1-phosphate thymidylyltransferase
MRGDVSKAIVLARGLGTRMRRNDRLTRLNAEQAQVANTGHKAMIPVGRPFMDYVLSSLADAGFLEVCLVVGPEHGEIRDYYTTKNVPRRLKLQFAIQRQALGTADALASAASFVGNDHFLVINSDNYYPAEVCAALRKFGQPAVAAFACDALIQESNFALERVRSFAVLKVSPDGWLEEIVEKPDALAMGSGGANVYVSMNCWLLTPAIFAACRSLDYSARGELELPLAIQHSLASLQMRFRALTFRAGVLDLSSRSDIAQVAERLRGTEVRL